MVIKPIPIKYAINLCNVDKFTCFSFSNKGFIGFLKTTTKHDVNSPQFMNDLIKNINGVILKENVAEILREDRNDLRSERKRAWSLKRTRAPFYNRAKGESNVHSFHSALKIAEKIVNELGSPWKESLRGRPPRYCSKKLVSALLVKHYFPNSFETLRARLLDINYDCRINPRNKSISAVPSKSELHWALTKIPVKYLQEAMRILDDWCVESHGKLFGNEEIHKFGVDATETTCNQFEEWVIGCKKGLRRQTNQINGLIRLVTNTFCEVITSKKVNVKDLTELLKKREESKRTIKNLEIHGDAAYDVERNYEITFLNDSKLIVNPTKYTKNNPKGFYRKKSYLNFSKGTYKTRKTVERPFANTYSRDGNKLYYRRQDMRQKGELLRFIAHNIKAYMMQEAWSKVFKNLLK
ncbi:MAG: hypothetical protein ACFFDN_02190 [Candidatus Hodarchaeota archaeon]